MKVVKYEISNKKLSPCRQNINPSANGYYTLYKVIELIDEYGNVENITSVVVKLNLTEGDVEKMKKKTSYYNKEITFDIVD